MGRLFRYYPEDFTLPPVKVLHMDLDFDIFDDHTKVISSLKCRTREIPLTALVLNARDLEVLSASVADQPATFEQDPGNNLIKLTFSRPIPPGVELIVRTETICRPTNNVLEGLYYDATPPGAPPTQITQCQQWGFQRIVPCIDDMTAKCTYRTTITADERYTHLISNGDIEVPRVNLGNGRSRIIYRNMTTPMAPYLFFAGVGTYEAFAREFEYPDGITFMLELLLPPGSSPGGAKEALDILSDAVLWVYLYTGPEQYKDCHIRDLLYQKIHELDALKTSGSRPGELTRIREELRELNSTIVPGYQYTGSIYREIAMQNSDFGGMENVGNTTITRNRIMPFPQMTDPSYEYMIGVKVHEYYHNLNGSEVTGMTPFELWLNEAVTAFIEDKYLAFLEGEPYSRLSGVLTLLAPGSGTFALDAGAASMPIEPVGFNDPNDLITSITYVKAPEFVRMIETRIGKEKFAEGLALYHTRYRHGNATWHQWIAAMEEVSGEELVEMAGIWLRQTRFPDITINGTYNKDTREYSLVLDQTGFGKGKPWIFPFRLALAGPEGETIAEKTVIVSGASSTIVFDDADEPAFVSLNRGYSFYGRVFTDVPDEKLILQAESDPDVIARFMAFYMVADREKMRMLEGAGSGPGHGFTGLFMRLISDDSLMGIAGGQFLTIFEGVESDRFAHHYTRLYDVRRRIMKAIAARNKEELIAVYHRYSQVRGESHPVKEKLSAIRYRQVGNTALALLSTLDSPDIHSIIRSRHERSPFASDRLLAFVLYMNSSAPDREELFRTFMEESKVHRVSWETFLSATGSISSPEVVRFVRTAWGSDAFQIEQTNDQRGLFGSFAQNRKISLETGEGRRLFSELLHRLVGVNEFTTVNLLRTCAYIDFMEEEHHLPLIGILASLMDVTSSSTAPVVYHTLKRLILGSPVARGSYEKAYGPIKGLEN